MASSNPRKRDRLDPRRVRIGGKRFWQVDMGSEVRNGKRHRLRKTFSSEAEARTFANLRKIERTNHGAAGVSLSPRLRGEAVEASKLLEPYGVTLLDLARQYVQRMEQSTKSETVENAVRILLSAKSADNLRPRYLKDLRARVGRFAQSFGERKVADITVAEIDSWLRSLGVAPLTRNTFRTHLSVFFEFSRQRGWVSANPLVDVPRAKVTGSVPGILSPEQAARLLESACEDVLPVFALGAFAGLRSAEIERLEWRHIKWDERLVEVPALSSKTASRRLVTMQPNLAAWLEPYHDHQGPLCHRGYRHRMIAAKRAAGIRQWPSNALRHSFASYHLAAFRNAAALSLELGHMRQQTVFAHYRELVRPSDAARYWQIAPAKGGASISVVA
jgi:integrase